ncbi:MAG: tRNA lysidine(34) synthetase TilS [Muribaculaceae bacterium]
MVSRLPQIVCNTIGTHNLIEQGAKVIVALSGGADSMAALAVLQRLGYQCVAAHCNFHLRGEESQRDQAVAEAVATQLGCECRVQHFNVPERCKATGESVEMACRSMRYEWFAQLSSEQSAPVAVAHHREDRVETLLLNLLRGTGIAGLVSMPYRRDYVIRPLLDCSRQQIEAYCREQGLQWVDDSSNASTEFQRNKLRINVLPQLERDFPGAVEAITRSIGHLSEDAAFFARAVAWRMEQYTTAEGVDLRRLAADEDGKLLLFTTLQPEGFTRSQTEDMFTAAAGCGGQFISRSGITRCVDHGWLRPVATAVDAHEEYVFPRLESIQQPVNLQVTRCDTADFVRPGRDASVLLVDGEAADRCRWTLRHPRRGDRIRPFGMQGSRLLSDLFADAKFSEAQKRAAWVLTADDVQVWVLGLRTSAVMPVTPESKYFYQLKINNLNSISQ